MPSERKLKIKAPVYVLVKVGKKILLLRRSEDKYDVWEAPGGKIEPNEKPIETAKRELKEETGIELPIEKFKLFTVGSVVYPDAPVMQVPIFFLVELDEEPKVVINPKEHRDYKFFTLKEIKKIENLALSVKCILEDLQALLF